MPRFQHSLLVLSRSLVSCQDGPITLCGTQEWAVGREDSSPSRVGISAEAASTLCVALR